MTYIKILPEDINKAEGRRDTIWAIRSPPSSSDWTTHHLRCEKKQISLEDVDRRPVYISN